MEVYMARKKLNSKPESQDNGKLFPLIRISNTTISVAKITKLIFDPEQKHIEIKVDNCTPTFTFEEDSPEKAYSLFLAVAERLKQTQNHVPFLFFGNAAIRLDLLNVIRVSGSSIIVRSGVGENPDFINFESEDAALIAFDELMLNLNLGSPSSRTSPEKYEKPPNDEIGDSLSA